MVTIAVCCFTAAILQANRAIGMFSQFASPTQSSDYYTPERYASFDVFAPVTVIIYAVSIYYAWKPRSHAEPALKRAPSSQSSRSPPRPFGAASGIDDTAACDSDVSLHASFESMDARIAARSSPLPIELESIHNSIATDDTTVIVVASSSDAD